MHGNVLDAMSRSGLIQAEAGHTGNRRGLAGNRRSGPCTSHSARPVGGTARAHRVAKALPNTRHSAIREILRGIARIHGQPVHQPVGLTTPERRRQDNLN
jgi:hypothetical protein